MQAQALSLFNSCAVLGVVPTDPFSKLVRALLKLSKQYRPPAESETVKLCCVANHAVEETWLLPAVAAQEAETAGPGSAKWAYDQLLFLCDTVFR